MSLSMNKILVTLITVAVVIVAVVFILAEVGSRQPSPEAPAIGGGELTVYPDTLLEGTITRINYETPVSFVIEADVSKIEGLAGHEKMVKTIKITAETAIVVYNLQAKVEAPVTVAELAVGDSVVVVTQESTKNNILIQEEFTAVKVSIMASAARPKP